MYKNIGTNCSFSFLRRHNLLSSLLLCLSPRSVLLPSSQCPREFHHRLWVCLLFVCFLFCFCFCFVSFLSALQRVRRTSESQVSLAAPHAGSWRGPLAPHVEKPTGRIWFAEEFLPAASFCPGQRGGALWRGWIPNECHWLAWESDSRFHESCIKEGSCLKRKKKKKKSQTLLNILLVPDLWEQASFKFFSPVSFTL